MKKIAVIACVCIFLPIAPLCAIDGILSVTPGWGITSSIYSDVGNSGVKTRGNNGFAILADYCGFFNDFFGIQAKVVFMLPFFGADFDLKNASGGTEKNDLSTVSAFALGPVFRFELSERMGMQVGVQAVVRTTLLKTKDDSGDGLAVKQPEAGLGLSLSGLYMLTQNIYLKFGVDVSCGWLVGNNVATYNSGGQQRVVITKMKELYSSYINITTYPFIGCSVQF